MHVHVASKLSHPMWHEKNPLFTFSFFLAEYLDECKPFGPKVEAIWREEEGSYLLCSVTERGSKMSGFDGNPFADPEGANPFSVSEEEVCSVSMWTPCHTCVFAFESGEKDFLKEARRSP